MACVTQESSVIPESEAAVDSPAVEMSSVFISAYSIYTNMPQCHLSNVLSTNTSTIFSELVNTASTQQVNTSHSRQIFVEVDWELSKYD